METPFFVSDRYALNDVKPSSYPASIELTVPLGDVFTQRLKIRKQDLLLELRNES